MTREARRSFRVSGLSIENINFTLGLIADRMDELEGRRGSPEFKADVDLNNNKLQNVGAATGAAEAAVFAQVPNIQSVWPVGSVFISVVTTNPSTLLGFGTWQAFGAGKMLVGVDVSDADFNSVEKTGGTKTVDLSHTHSTPAHTHPAGTAFISGGVSANDGLGGAGTTGNGGSSTQSILNPYITTYFWKRVS